MGVKNEPVLTLKVKDKKLVGWHKYISFLDYKHSFINFLKLW